MTSRQQNRRTELEHELEIASLRSHELHMRYIYGLRWGALALSALAIVIGAIMIFFGLQGSFTWAVETPNSVGAKLTNASPGIVFATVGMILGFVVILQKPVSYSTGARSKIAPIDEVIGASLLAEGSERQNSVTLRSRD